MNKIPSPILTIILSISGPFPNILRLAKVCKKWRNLISKAQHYVSFQGSLEPKFFPGSIDIRIALSKFLDGWKIFHLDLKNVYILDVDFLAKIIVSQPQMISLDLSNNKINLENFLLAIEELNVDLSYEGFLGKKNFILEVLKITNNKTNDLRFDLLVKIFPNLKQLYAGNTEISPYDLKVLIENSHKIEVLDISNCPKIDALDEFFFDLNINLKALTIKKLFISPTKSNSIAIELLKNKGLTVIDTTIGKLLHDFKTNDDTQRIENMLNQGLDVNLMSEIHNEDVSSYPQMEIIREIKNQELLMNLFRVLIRYGLDLSHHSHLFEKTLINSAINFDHKELLRILISNGADLCPVPYGELLEILRGRNDHHGFTSRVEISDLYEKPAATFSAHKGNWQICELFFEFGLEKIDFYKSKHCNPVCSAAVDGNIELFSYLIINKFPYYKCPQHRNYLLENYSIVEIAISEGYLKSAEIPLWMIYEASRFYTVHQHESQAIRLLEFIIHLDIKNQERKLLYSDRRLNMESIYYKPLMCLAIQYKSYKVLSWLLKNGFDINSEDEYGWTGFMLAADSGNYEILSYLYKHGAKIDKVNQRGQTSLHLAVENGHIEVVKELIRLKAHLSPTSNEKSTPLDFAMINQRTAIKDMLLAHGAVSGENLKKRCEMF
ncbi:unnamed protein product [Blepharisma stoltei]|uniref:F-box domain-containing protein n=1 Tax=Blepharisma stoltei TaxID=1481888 RepID=A0AAU9JJM0_9CILI|nr:unnamed protein product [Blepharisma stoltei]